MEVLLIFVVFGSFFFPLFIFSILKLFVFFEKMQTVDLVQHQSRLFSPSVSVYKVQRHAVVLWKTFPANVGGLGESHDSFKDGTPEFKFPQNEGMKTVI